LGHSVYTVHTHRQTDTTQIIYHAASRMASDRRLIVPAMERCMMKNFMRDFRPMDDVTMDSRMAKLATTIATKRATRNAICGVCNQFNRQHILNASNIKSHITRCSRSTGMVLDISQGKSIIGLQDLFTLDKNNKGTRGHALKLSKTRCTRDYRKYFF